MIKNRARLQGGKKSRVNQTGFIRAFEDSLRGETGVSMDVLGKLMVIEMRKKDLF